MARSFIIILVIVAITGFSISAYIFSQNNLNIDIIPTIQTDNPASQSLLLDIEKCIEENLVGDSVSLNSFNTNMLMMLKESAENAGTEKEVEEIRNKFNHLVNCDI